MKLSTSATLPAMARSHQWIATRRLARLRLLPLTPVTKYPWGTETYRATIEHKTSDEHPENTSVKGSHRLEVTLPDRVLLWDAELNFSSDLDNFYYHYVRRITENGELVREKEWTETIKRDYQ